MSTQHQENRKANLPGQSLTLDFQYNEPIPGEELCPFVLEKRHWASVVQEILEGEVPEDEIDRFADKAAEYSRANSFSEYVMPLGLDPSVGPAVLHEALRSAGCSMPPEDPVTLTFQIKWGASGVPRGGLWLKNHLLGYLTAGHSRWTAKLDPFGLEFEIAASPSHEVDSQARYIPQEEDYVFLVRGAAGAALSYRQCQISM